MWWIYIANNATTNINIKLSDRSNIVIQPSESSLHQRIQPLHVVHVQLVQSCMVECHGGIYSDYNDLCSTWQWVNLKRNVNNLYWQCYCFYSNRLKERPGFEECNLRVSLVYEYHQKMRFLIASIADHCYHGDRE